MRFNILSFIVFLISLTIVSCEDVEPIVYDTGLDKFKAQLENEIQGLTISEGYFSFEEDSMVGIFGELMIASDSSSRLWVGIYTDVIYDEVWQWTDSIVLEKSTDILWVGDVQTFYWEKSYIPRMSYYSGNCSFILKQLALNQGKQRSFRYFITPESVKRDADSLSVGHYGIEWDKYYVLNRWFEGAVISSDLTNDSLSCYSPSGQSLFSVNRNSYSSRMKAVSLREGISPVFITSTGKELSVSRVNIETGVNVWSKQLGIDSVITGSDPNVLFDDCLWLSGDTSNFTYNLIYTTHSVDTAGIVLGETNELQMNLNLSNGNITIIP
jgi:hypothetical protein